MTERPDPLAEPEGYGVKPGDADRDVLSICATIVTGGNCQHPVTEIWWFGCTVGEHAGPIAYCSCHSTRPVTMNTVCDQCRKMCTTAPVRWLRRTDVDGNELALPGDPQYADPRAQAALDWVTSQGRRFA